MLQEIEDNQESVHDRDRGSQVIDILYYSKYVAREVVQKIVIEASKGHSVEEL